MEQIINHGLRPDTRTPEEKMKDFEFGGTTKVIPIILQTDGQWTNFLPAYEYQNTNFETLACVTFSAINCLEILHKRKYCNEQNWSDRFTAKMSGTNHNGNSLYNVGESLRKLHGEVKQFLWKNNALTWDEFYKDIPQDIQDAGLSTLNTYKIQYEWLREPFTSNVLKNALMYSPIQIGIYAYGKLVNGIYQKPEVGQAPNHAVTLIGYKEGEYWLIFDHYLGNEIRKLAWDYTIGFAMKYDITNKDMILRKEINKPAIYLMAGGKKIKLLDMETLNAIAGNEYEEVTSLAEIPDGGTLGWYERMTD